MRFLFLALSVACTSDEPRPSPEPSADPTNTDPLPTGTPTETETDTVPETDPPTSTSTPTGPRLRMMLHGGGPEDEALYAPFVEASGYGHIVTLGARPSDDPDLTWFDGWWPTLGAASAATVNATTPAEASDPAIVAALAQADAIFIRGGDQSLYLAAWVGTPLEEALVDAFDRGAVIGGTSAGCAILGGRIYDARVASVAPYEVLLDPFDPGVTFSEPIFDLLPHVLTDTHFTERGRLGRLTVFAERWEADGGPGAIAVGVDPETALFVYDDGTAEVAGRGSVTIVDPGPSTATLTPGRPPDIRGQRFWQLPAGYVVDLDPVTVIARPAWVTAPPTGSPLSGWPMGAIDGSALADRRLGEWMIPNLDADPYGWYDGELVLGPGDGALPGALVVTALYEDSAYFENHQGGMAWFLAQHPDAVALGVDLYLDARVAPPATLRAPNDSYVMVLDGRSATHVGVPPVGDWQTAAIEEGTLSIVGPGTSWDGSAVP